MSVFYPVTYLDHKPSGGWTDEYKTTKLVLRAIPSGRFKREDGKTVTLSKDYYVGVFEVTQKQWELVMGTTPSNFKGASKPVETVSYDDIWGKRNGAKWPAEASVDSDSFIGRLRQRTGGAFDLPTEAQWEYACRAGTTGDYAGTGKLEDMGWYKDNSGDQTQEVGQKKPNALGLYDMHGNVWEWSLDWYEDYDESRLVDPAGASSGLSRVGRGGCWSNSARYCRSAYCTYWDPSRRIDLLGFRLACFPGRN